VLGEHGASDFAALQNAFDAGGAQIRYFRLRPAVLRRPRPAPGRARRAARAARRACSPTPTASSASARTSSPTRATILRNRLPLHLEGVIGKRLDSAYVGGRTRDWIKLKCTLRQEFVIGGYTEPQGSRTGLGALLLGIHDERGRLRYAGNVGTGFDVKTLGALRRQLGKIETAQTPFVDKPREARGTWVEPKLGRRDLVLRVDARRQGPPGGLPRPAQRQAAERESRARSPRRRRAARGRNRQADGADAMRSGVHPKAGAARESAKVASPTSPSAPAAGDEAGARGAARFAARGGDRNKRPKPRAKRRPPALPASVKVTHPERVIDPQSGHTKRDLVDYYLHAARRIQPHLQGRPVALVRAPAGVGGHLFFQKHSGSLRIDDLVELPLRSTRAIRR
jgi:bifunctional non-homologous end joining protein LigD